MGAAGAGSVAQVINAALAGRRRFDEMRAFFEGVGAGAAAGVWEDVPREHPEFAARHRAAVARARRAEEATGC
jgi:chlorophyllide a reductase subunit Y